VRRQPRPVMPPNGAAAPLATDLRGLVRVNLGWSFLNQISARLLSFASGIVLARLLVPRDFGIFAVALIAIEALQSLNDLGLLTGLVREQGDYMAMARTGVTLALSSSVVLFIVSLLAAGPFAAALNASEATGVLRLLMLAILIDGVSVVPAALLSRALRQDLRALADLTGTVVNVAVAITLAAAGTGAWALAGGRLAGNAVAAAIIILVAPARPVPGFDRGHARSLLSFGLPIAGATLVLFALQNVDYVVVGHFLGPAALGLYLLASNLAGWPINLISYSVRRVSLPGFARLVHDPPALARGFVNSLVLLLTGLLLGYLLLFALAQPLVNVAYGQRWALAAAVLPGLTLLGAVRGAAYLVDDLLAAVGRATTTLVLHLIWLLLLVPAVVVGARTQGLTGVALAQAVVAVIILGPYALAMRTAGVVMRKLAAGLRATAGALAAAALVAAVMLRMVPGDLARLALVGSAITVAYVLVAASSTMMRRLVRP
jgi:O-antigen/teichoic acid export membrane protein